MARKVLRNIKIDNQIEKKYNGRKKILNSLDDNIKEQIASKYGSVDKFYNIVYTLSSQYFNAFMSKNKEVVNTIETKRFEIAQELEAMGVVDGLAIYDAISGDFDEQYVKTHIPPLTPEQEALLKSLDI